MKFLMIWVPILQGLHAGLFHYDSERAQNTLPPKLVPLLITSYTQIHVNHSFKQPRNFKMLGLQVLRKLESVYKHDNLISYL